MKIVQINANYAIGSIGRTTAELHEWLMQNGYESYVFTPQLNVKAKNVFKIGNKFDHKLHGFFSRLIGLQGYFSIVSTWLLIQKLKQIKPDIIHLRNLHGNYICLPLLLEYVGKTNIGCVVTLHDCWFFTGHCCHYTKPKCKRWLEHCGNCPMKKYDNVSWFFDFSSKILKDKQRLFSNIKRLAIIGNSIWTMNQAKMSILKNAALIDYIYNWIDTSIFYPRRTKNYWNKLNIGKEAFSILGVCDGWSDKKGLKVFVELSKRLPDCHFILVGGIKELITLPSNISVIERTLNNDELCEYYTYADVLLNPSLEETFGKVSAEALCCGTPIIVNRATANPELVGNGCGYIVDNNDVELYLVYINKIRLAGKRIYSSNCISFANKNFGKERNIRAYIDVYEKI